MAWIFQTDGDYVNFNGGGGLFRLARNVNCVTWHFDETGDLFFDVYGQEYTVKSGNIGDVIIDGVPLAAASDFPDAIRAVFTGLSSPGGSSGCLPLALTDDLTKVENTLDESWGSVLNVRNNPSGADNEEWFAAIRLGNFNASYWDGGWQGTDASGLELVYANSLEEEVDTNFSWMRFLKDTLLIEVGNRNLGNVGDFQVTGGAFPSTYMAALGDDSGFIAAQQINNIIGGIPKAALNSYDRENESELYVTPEKVLATFAEKNGDPDATDIPNGYYGVYKHTGTNAIKLWVNDGGSFKSVTLS